MGTNTAEATPPCNTQVNQPTEPTISVTYWDLMIKTTRYRHFSSLKEALNFIERRAVSPHLYNNFILEIHGYG